MNDNWTNTLRQLESEYDKLANIMENGIKIRAVIRQVNFGWRVRIEEVWHEGNGERYYTADYSNLDLRCEWAAEQLKDWRFTTRLSHQEWKFFNRRQAEKFLIMFNLKWAE